MNLQHGTEGVPVNASGVPAPGVGEVVAGNGNGARGRGDAGKDAEVLGEAAEELIERKAIGERIKYLRQRKGMGLVELGRHTGLSASFLSQLETGRVVPTLRNLARIAMVFSRDISFFFEPEREDLFRIIRAEERARLPQTGADVPGYYFENLGGVMNGQHATPYFAEFLPADGKRAQRAHRHAGAEFLYVLTGCLQITHGERTETFEAGDAVYFHADVEHSYQRVGEEACTALILSMPERSKRAGPQKVRMLAPGANGRKRRAGTASLPAASSLLADSR